METLEDLDSNLQDKLGLPLKIAKGKPNEVFKGLSKAFTVTSLTFESEQVEPYGSKRDKEVMEL